MKSKAVAGLAIILLLVITAFNAAPTQAQATLKVGIIGPMQWIQGQGMVEGATLAMEEINDAGGVDVGGEMHTIELVTSNSGPGGAEPTEETGRAAMLDLIGAGVDYVQGGFRSEAVFGMREVACDFDTIFQITGSATNELIDCEGQLGAMLDNPCGACVRDDYDRYKYLFRVTPTNSTMLLTTLAIFYQTLIGTKLLPLYGYVHEGDEVPKVDTAVVVENAVWADMIWNLYTIEELPSPPYKPGLGYKYLLGPYVDIAFKGRPSPEQTSFDSILNGIQDNNARLIIHIFSAEAGLAFMQQWADWEIDAIPIGIDVLAQESDHWERTAGKCEFEGTLATSNSAHDNTLWQTEFATHYVETFGHDPIYTSYGAYDALYSYVEAVEAAGTLDPGEGRGAPGVITELENNVREAMSVPYGKVTYNHDLYCDEPGATYQNGFGRPFLIQWQSEKKVFIFPFDMLSSRKFRLPTYMYPLETDLNWDGTVDIFDVVTAAKAFGGAPGDPQWDKEVDITGDAIVDIFDIVRLAGDFGKSVDLPITQFPPEVILP